MNAHPPGHSAAGSAPPAPSSSHAAGGAYASNTDAAGVCEFLRAAPSVAVLTHVKPDGDAIGSVLAATRALRRLAIDARACFVGPRPQWFTEMVGDTPLIDSADLAAAPPAFDPARVLVVDTGSWAQLDELADWVRARGARTCVVDHHLHGDPAMAARRLIDTSAAAAAQIVAVVCCGLLGKSSWGAGPGGGTPGGGGSARVSALPIDVCDPLYLGLATDTGWFRFSNTTAATLAMASELLAAGVEHTRLYAMVEQQDRPSRLRLLHRALGTLEFVAGGRACMMSLRRADFHETRAEPDDSGGFTDLPLGIREVRAAAVLTEAEPAGNPAKPALTKVSFRSKPGDDAVDVGAIAARLGGGGHARASGVRLAMDLVQATAVVRRVLDET